MNVLCDSCEQRPAIRVVRFGDLAMFAVCQLCAPVVDLPDVTHVQLDLVRL
jgi:hypothetical protein